MNKFETVDQYIGEFPSEVQERLKKIRNGIKKVVPEATETISYQMPTFKLNGKNLIHFAAFTNHIGIYPLPETIKIFEKDLSRYKQGKGSIQFQNNEPLPIDLIKKITLFRKEAVEAKN